MGDVFVARDRTTDEKVALKLLSTHDPRVVERFLREAQILAEISHPTIVGHIAHGVDDDLPYLVMRWVPGRSLHELLSGGATLSIHETLDLAARLAEALALIHGRGIIHRDLKPANIILENDDAKRAVLLDFGIAHVGDHDLTRTGELLGTPGYLSPEQAQGAMIDARADIFALGCVLFRCLVGRPPFDARDPLSAAVKVLLEEAPVLAECAPGVPRGFDDLVTRMLARDPDDRPKDGSDLTREIARLLDPSPTIDERTIVKVRREPPVSSTRLLGGAERKLFSLVIARRRDWERTAAGIERVREVLNEHLAAFGMRSSLLADGSIVVTIHDDSPNDAVLRAARAALFLARELPDAQVALATGRGVMDDDVPVGEIVERAIGLLDQRTQSGVFVDQTSASLLVGRFAIEERSEDVGTVRILVGESRAGRTLLGKPSALVGRTRELTMLELMLDECRTDSVARAMLITAEPGVGKSRLCAEFVSRARRKSKSPVRLWTAYGDPLARSSPLSMLAGLITSAAEIHRADSPKERRRKLAARASQLGCTSDVAALLSEVIAPVPDNDESASSEIRVARRDRLQFATLLRAAWETFVCAACNAGPLILMLEDLHWSDARTVELVDGVLAAARDLPLLVVALARPEVHTIFPRLFASHGLQEMKLLNLTSRASAELVQASLGAAATEAVTSAIVARAQGNALFLEELIRAAAEGAFGTPESLVAMMDRRFSTLDAHARRVLRAVSIFGDVATTEGVHALVGGESATAVAATLARMMEAEMLLSTEGGYAFRHALLREAAYATLTEEDRRLGHQLAGEWLSVHRPDTNPLVLAEHFLNGGEPKRARGYFYAAAEAALAKNDLESSLLHAARVESLDPPPEMLAGIRMMQAEANLWRDDPAALHQAAEMLTLLPRHSALWYRGAAGLLFVAAQLADFSTIVRVVAELEEEGPRDPSSETASMQIMAYSMAVWLLSMVGVRDRAKAFFERVRKLESLGDDDALGWLGIGHYYLAKYVLGDCGVALTAIRTSRAKFSRIGDLRLTVLAQVLEGSMLHELGAYEEALPILEATLATCERIDLSAARGDTKRWIGCTLEALGRFEEALAMQRAASNEILNTLTYRGAAKVGVASVLIELGRFEEARVIAREASFELTFAPSHCAHALAKLAACELRVGDREAALEAARRAVAIVDSMTVIGGGEAPIFVVLAEIYDERGEHAAAARTIERGASLVRTRAARILDPHYRRSFEERVVANAWLLRSAKTR